MKPRSEYEQSQYEENSEFVLSDEEREPLSEPGGEIIADSPNPGEPRSPNISNSLNGSSQQFINHIDTVVSKVKSLAQGGTWESVLRHRSGVEVFAQKNVAMIGNTKVAPVFKGVGLIRGYSPASVFSVIGSSKLWDDWYEDGNLVENLSDEVSLTYMCMQAALGTRTRDLSLVEKVEVTDDGSVFFCASSVDTPRVPPVPGRVRAHIELNGWVLEPADLSSAGLTDSTSSIGTKISYYLQIDVKTFIPEAISQRYLAKRPLCITKIDSYLQKHGSPLQMEGIDESESHPRQGGNRKTFNRGFLSLNALNQPNSKTKNRSSSSSVVSSLNASSDQTPSRSRKPTFASLGRSHKFHLQRPLSTSNSVPAINLQSPNLPSDFAPTTDRTLLSPPNSTPAQHVHRDDDHVLMIDHVPVNQAALSYQALNSALGEFETQLIDRSNNEQSWTVANDCMNLHKIWYKPYSTSAGVSSKDCVRLPLVGGEVTILSSYHDRLRPLTKEQVLITLTSNVAQQLWDVNLVAHGLSETDTSPHPSLIKTENGFDQSTHIGAMRGIHPHLPERSLFCFDQMVVRQSKDNKENSVSARITVIQSSTQSNMDPLDNSSKIELHHSAQNDLDPILKDAISAKTLSHLKLSGWLIETGRLQDEIKLTHLCALELNSTQQALSDQKVLSPFIERIIISNIANRPHDVHQFILDNGFFPGWIRWTEGEILYLGDCVRSDSELIEVDAARKGEVEWRFRRHKTSGAVIEDAITTALALGSTESQICWFQWSSQMYECGIELTLDPPEAAKVLRVKKMDNTLQFNWNPSSLPAEASDLRLRAKQISDHKNAYPGNVIVNGELLKEEVYPPVRSSKRKHSSAIKSPTSLRNGVINSDSSSTGANTKETRPPSDASGPNLVLAGIKTDHREPMQGSSTATLSASDRRFSPTSIIGAGSDLSTTTVMDGQVLVDSNVMLIITQDLYFTKSQVLFLSLCVGLAYAYGKFA
ncbi:uncharacterized protein MELLADRAFT_79707 [Melampsora larici-populina 98AG31]|uniref:START domain-containing protein n=1 Tax=Melampsora larici-populina (strain 98AG31 / pathotype 3-4-7) TaxID=747676 RepID=F4SAF3_MELLP|nr:uncharacterized protein MELLADRAFT_79707 [Melampsora larici-populina 98AG31]EGF98377.1 hypothetical protein MELLADRAFT_79707 [Melampsora larici-populina 98AG31]